MATVKGDTLTFGIGSDVLGALTQKVSITKKCERKEAKDKQGETKAVAFYRNTTDVSLEIVGEGTAKLLDALSLPTGAPNISGGLYVEELTTDRSNEDFVKQSLKATAYEGIS